MIDETTADLDLLRGRWITSLSQGPEKLCETGCGDLCKPSHMMCERHCEEYRRVHTSKRYQRPDVEWLDEQRGHYLPLHQLSLWHW